jgi:uncharacterized protein YfaS (alpha-2-macroglobulin family)
MSRTSFLILGTIVILITFIVGVACVLSASSTSPVEAQTATSTPLPTPLPPRPQPGYIPVPPGTISPVVIQRSPEQGEELPPDGFVEIVFDRAMDRPAVEAAFTLTPTVTGKYEWADERTLRFRPARPLKRGGLYDVVLTQEARAVDGAPLAEPYVFRFFTTGFLEVGQVMPADGTQDVDPAVIITVIFNRPVVPLTALAEQAQESSAGEKGLPEPLKFDPPISGRGEWLNTSIYVFTPDKPLAGGTTYTARVVAGLTDTTGGLLESDYVWHFATAPPDVVFHSPEDGAKLVPINASITVQFNQPVDPASAREAFTLRSGLAGPVQGTFDVQGATLTFTPTARLEFDREYEARVKAGVTSVAGGQGMRQDRAWRFRTVPLPRIVKTIPADGERNAPPYTDFAIVFNAPINPDTVMPNLSMTPPLSPTQVYTYFSPWDATFHLAFGAKPSSDYEVRIGPDIADPYGNVTGQQMTVRFRTAPLEPDLRLHVPDIIGTYNAYDPARLYMAYVNVNRVDLKLYRLAPGEIKRNSWEWRDYQPPPSGLVREWSQPLEAPLNKRSYAPIDLVEGGGRLEPGLYLLDASAPGVESDRWGNRHVLVVSRINLTLKSGQKEGLVWATDLSTGKPVSGVEINFYTEQNLLATATSGPYGVAQARFELTHRVPILAFSESPFSAVSDQWNQGIGPWDFGLQAGYELRKYNVYIYTDRPIYRPAQKVDFRGAIRAEEDVHYTLPSGLRQVHVVVMAPGGEQVYEQDLALSEYGTFHDELALADGAPLGNYNIRVSFQGRSFGSSFQVAAYRPPEFEVAVTPAEGPEVVRGQKTQATVEVKYFFGGPVADAPVTWNVLAETYIFKPPWGGRYQFTDTDDPWLCFDCWWRPPEPPQPILSGSGVTDKQGHFQIDIPADLPVIVGQRPITGSVRLTVEASVTGRDNQVISGRGEIIAHRGDFYVGLSPKEYVGKEGKPTSIDLVAVDWAGKRLAGKEITVSFYQREWINNFIENETGGGTWKWETKDTLVTTVSVTTDDKGEAVATFTPPRGGSYHVVAESVDSGGRTVRSSLFIWVTGKEYVSWQRENNDRINLIADKSSYLPGEKAQILIPSPYEGSHKALVTIERGGILQYEVIEMTSNSQVYELPITADHVPNIYVSVVLVKGQSSDAPLADYKVGYVPLEVKPVVQTLKVTLTPDRPQAGPGESVAYSLQVTDREGKPVSGEFSLDLVDKAILTLQPRQPDAIVQTFYGRQPLGINTASGLAISVNRLLKEVEEDLGVRREAKGGGPGAPVPTAVPAAAPPAPMEEAPAMAKEAGAAPPPGVQVREKFADTAYWNASIVTDKEGKAVVTVKLPDNLTTWVMRGVGLTTDTRVGEGTVDLLVTKPLLIRPVASRFFVVGDRARLGAVVNNNTDAERKVEIALSADGVTLSSPAKQTVVVPARGEAKVNWDVVVSDVTQAQLIFSAVSGEYSDASKPRLATGPDGSLLVLRYSAPEVVGTAGQMEAAGSRTEIVALPPRFNERQGELSIQLDPSLAAGMRDGLTYLEHYPYECTEQTVSRFLPNVLTYRALKDLGLSDPELEKRLPELVKTGVEKLVSQQHDDGGWGWWYKSQSSNPHLSAYVLFGLLKARQADFAVPAKTIDRAIDYLNGQLVSPEGLNSYREANQQAFILYVLAEAGATSKDRLADLYERRDKLSHYGRAFLALALNLSGDRDGRIKTILSDLNNAAILSATGAHWEEINYDWWAMNTDTRSTAVILDALARLDKGNALIPNVVRWLMVARKEGIWETTQETAWALISLTDWMVATGELQAQYDYQVSLNDVKLASGTATRDNVGESVKLRVAVADMLRDVGNKLTISRGEGPGRLYYTAHLRVFLPVEEIKAIDRGVIVSRRYTLASCDQGAACPDVREARVGDVIRVDLTIIAPHDLYYVVVEDPLPAGAEAIDPNLATTSLLDLYPSLRRQAQKPYWEDFYRWWWQWYSRSELRDEKMVLFADYLYKGTYQFSYTMRATLPGDYHVIPTTAHEFYFPEVFGRSDGRLLSIGGE